AQIEGSRLARFAGLCCHTAARDNIRSAELGTHLLKHDITIRCAHGDVELILEIDFVASRSHHEIWRFGGTLCFDVVEQPAKFAPGGKDSRDSVEKTKIRPLKCVVSRNRRLPGLSSLPWPEAAACLDFSRRFGVRKTDMERHSPGTPDILQFS